jgi:hypothetical protein
MFKPDKHEMNEAADWVGVIKNRATGGRPNCQDELERIAGAHGGKLGTGGGERIEKVCAEVAAKIEASNG